MDIINDIAKLHERVGALETQGTQSNSLSRITKLYGNVKVTATIITSTHQYPVCSTDLYCNTDLYI